MAFKRKPPPAFEAVFEGPGLYPEKIPLGYLTRLLSAVQRLAAGQEADQEADEEDQAAALSEEGKIALLDVRRGSAAFQFIAPVPAVAVNYLRETGKILERPETIGQNEYVLSPVEELSAIARSLDCRIILREPGKDSEILARIEPLSYSTISQKLFIRGDTAITGVVKRVGGATGNKCALRVPFQNRLLFCKVKSVAVARRLGRMLYDEVAVQGAATWLKTSWKIVAFTITGVHQPKLKSAEETIEALRNAGGSGWDKIDDPDEYLEEVGGGR